MCHVKSSQVKSSQAIPSWPVKSCHTYVCIFGCVSKQEFEQNFETDKLSYLSLALSLSQVNLFKHLRPLFHHQGLLVSVG